MRNSILEVTVPLEVAPPLDSRKPSRLRVIKLLEADEDELDLEDFEDFDDFSDDLIGSLGKAKCCWLVCE